MTDTKKCEECSLEFSRPKGLKTWNWNQRRFCSPYCTASYGAKLAEQSKPKTVKDPRFDNYTLSDVIRDCGGSTKLSEKIRVMAATIREWRKIPEKHVTRVSHIGNLPRYVVARAVSDKPPEPVAKPKMCENRVESFPAGHDATWGAMMPGVSWKEAQAMTSHMGRL